MKQFVKLIIWILLISSHHQLKAQNYPYPLSPDTISGKQGKIVYMAEHFWDTINIGDSLIFKAPTLLLDYVYLLRHIDDNLKQYKNIKKFVSLCADNPSTIKLITFWLDNILFDARSPQYNEPIYLIFLKEVQKTNFDKEIKMFAKERLKILTKNEIGKQANNFVFKDKKGISHKLSDIEAPLILLIFNNPDCSLCHKAENSIQKDEIIQKYINNDSLKIVSIALDADYNAWLNHHYPDNWVVGFDCQNKIIKKRLYNIQYLPSMYLLDHDKKVIVKEADYEMVKACFWP